MKLFLRLSQVVPLRECSAAVLRTWERPASLPPATSSISSVRMKTQHRLFFFTWNKLISPRRGWWDSDCAGYFFKNKPTNAFLFQRVGFCCVTWFKKTFFFCRFLIGGVQWSGPGKQERFLKKKENEAKTTCSTKLIPFSCPPGFYSFFVVRFFFLYIYLFFIFFKSRDVFTVLIWKIRAEYRWWLTCSGDRRLCVSVRDPSEACIRGAVMYAGRKRRKPVQRA